MHIITGLAQVLRKGLLAQVDFLYPFASYQHSIIKQSQHWPISLINILPVGPILSSSPRHIWLLLSMFSRNRQSCSYTQIHLILTFNHFEEGEPSANLSTFGESHPLLLSIRWDQYPTWMGQSYTPRSILHVNHWLFSYSVQESARLPDWSFVKFQVQVSCRIHEEEMIISVLTSLKSLCLSYSSSAAEDFLDNLIAPHLKEFSFRRYYAPIIEPEFVASFLRRSACSHSLSMIFSIIPQYFKFFINLVQSMPSLTTLSLLSITTFKITLRIIQIILMKK